MTDGQLGAVCPQCGSSTAVHSIEELAALARARLGEQPWGANAPQQGWAAEPQAGPVPQQGWAAEPQAGPVPQQGWAAEPKAGALPGYMGQPQAGPPPGNWRDRDYGSTGGSIVDALGEDIAGAALTAAGRFIGRAISRRVQRTVSEKVMPTLGAGQDELLRQQIAIADRHPDLRACLTDGVIFLAGGSRVLPMSSASGMLTVEQSDALVAQLREN